MTATAVGDGAGVAGAGAATDLVAADDVNFSAVTSGINVQQGSPFLLTNFDALQALVKIATLAA